MSVRFSRLRASERGVFNTRGRIAQKPVIEGYFSVCVPKNYSATLVSALFGKVLEL